MEKQAYNKDKIKQSHNPKHIYNQIGKQYCMLFLSYPFLSSRVPNIEFKCLFSHKQHFGHKGCPVKYKESTDLSKWGGKDW